MNYAAEELNIGPKSGIISDPTTPLLYIKPVEEP